MHNANFLCNDQIHALVYKYDYSTGLTVRFPKEAADAL